MDNAPPAASLLPRVTAPDRPGLAAARAVPPPPMRVVHEGWFRDHVSYATVEEVLASIKR